MNYQDQNIETENLAEETAQDATELTAAEAESAETPKKHAKIKLNNTTKNLILTALFSALCIVLPMAFHAVPQGGLIFCPMHIPVLLCAMICGWQYGLVTALAGPTLSMLLTGMPNAAVLPSMLIECAVYAIVSGLLMKFVHTKHVYADMYISLAVAMIAGRVIGGICKALLFTDGEYTIAMWATAYFVKALPGIALHLALIPNVIFALMKAHLVDERY